MGQVHVALVFIFFSKHYLNDGVLLPVVELPLHLDVLSLSQIHKATQDPALEDRELAALLGLHSGLSASILHDLPECRDRYMGWVRAS